MCRGGGEHLEELNDISDMACRVYDQNMYGAPYRSLDAVPARGTDEWVISQKTMSQKVQILETHLAKLRADRSASNTSKDVLLAIITWQNALTRVRQNLRMTPDTLAWRAVRDAPCDTTNNDAGYPFRRNASPTGKGKGMGGLTLNCRPTVTQEPPSVADLHWLVKSLYRNEPGLIETVGTRKKQKTIGIVDYVHIQEFAPLPPSADKLIAEAWKSDTSKWKRSEHLEEPLTGVVHHEKAKRSSDYSCTRGALLTLEKLEKGNKKKKQVDTW